MVLFIIFVALVITILLYREELRQARMRIKVLERNVPIIKGETPQQYEDRQYEADMKDLARLRDLEMHHLFDPPKETPAEKAEKDRRAEMMGMYLAMRQMDQNLNGKKR